MVFQEAVMKIAKRVRRAVGGKYNIGTRKIRSLRIY
jgi:hypothetical protein